MNLNDLYPSKFFKASDLGGVPQVLTIQRIGIEDLGDPKKPERKPVLYFAGKDKGLVLNKTNALTIAARFGPELEDWIGGRVELFATIVQGPSGPCEGIRLRTVEKAVAQPAAPPAVSAAAAGAARAQF